jgi:hypothetical protein
MAAFTGSVSHIWDIESRAVPFGGSLSEIAASDKSQETVATCAVEITRCLCLEN